MYSPLEQQLGEVQTARVSQARLNNAARWLLVGVAVALALVVAVAFALGGGAATPALTPLPAAQASPAGTVEAAGRPAVATYAVDRARPAERDDRIDSLMRPLADQRRRRGKVRADKMLFDLEYATPEQADPRWHRPANGTHALLTSPTTLVWILNKRPPAAVLFRARMSLASVLRRRDVQRPLRLFLAVFESPAELLQIPSFPSPTNDSGVDFCAALVPSWRREELTRGALATTAGDRVCRELVSDEIDSKCEMPSSAHSAAVVVGTGADASGVTLTVVRVGGAWQRHPDLLAITSAWVKYIGEAKKRKKRLRPDLFSAAPTILSRYFMPQLLLRHGVERFVYLDSDTCALAPLDPLYALPLSARYFIGYARRQRHDDVYTREFYNVTHPLAATYGLYNDEALAVNTGVFVVDTKHMCSGDGFRRMAELARKLVAGGGMLFSRAAGFDQPLSVVALAASTTYADPRWNCRRPWTAFDKCWLLHTGNCADGVHSGLPDATWLAQARFFGHP
ncbi:hypothetical protein T492DRAFT_902079, partial [Pavlovales sp. CCMP2436]